MNKISLIISTYNWPAALSLCLQSICAQTVLPMEVIIADDGSRADTKQLISGFQQIFSIPLKHVWQEDEGFKLTQIRNKAIAQATGEYIIQIDGDVILHPLFIADHIRVQQKGTLVIGSRSHLLKDFSEEMLVDKSVPSVSKLRQNAKDFLNHMRIPWLTDFLKYRYKVSRKHRFTAKGCNMAFWKDDFIAVNGYNEQMTGWGSEDEELVVRLIYSGVKKQFLKMSGIVFHIYHPLVSREKEETNYQILSKAVRDESRFCKQGIDQYLQ